MTNNDLRDWKQHPVTKQVFASLQEREEQIKETLVISAGIDSGQDREYVGYVKALKDIYLIEAADVGDVK